MNPEVPLTPRAMGGEPPLSPELKALEAQLAALRPREDRLDRERLAFEAGRASVLTAVGGEGTRHWVWPASMGALAATVAMLLVMATVARPGGTAGLQSPDGVVVRQSPVEIDPATAKPRGSSTRLARAIWDQRPRDPRGLYLAGMSLTSLESALCAPPSQWAGRAAAQQGQPTTAPPIFSPRSLGDALGEDQGGDSPS